MVLEIMVANSFTSVQPACHEDESFALMQFKDSFAIHKSASLCDPKVLQWKSHGVNSNNCCSWDGVQCDGKTGHVIGLDLSSSCLSGSINSNSTLFNLVHLQSLNLAGNNFNYFEIRVSVGQLMSLTYLNLSGSAFSGQIPLEISNLFKLSHLDLSFNYDEIARTKLLKLQSPNMSTLLQNLTSLEVLDLSEVEISSMVPDFLANFTSFTSIILYDYGLKGEFPAAIFQLPNLRILDVGANGNLKGCFPKFHNKSPLRELRLGGSGFSGSVPSSI
ncbi:receptor-like protein 7 [Ziziphus jujuba]|uniref:Receptor-like protein 7 n=1 Tax=Ziziphus jujuba TaxID=326968 RepID=A0ABM4A2T7_ZIZJJ|nr:receptor-like protein 7 [Ziziphus jujuba]